MNKQKLRKLAEKATPGKWTANQETCSLGEVCSVNQGGEPWFEICSDSGFRGPNNAHDAAYIAAANPATILALLDENAVLLEAMRDLRDFYEELTNLPACKANSAIAKAESS